MSAAAPTATAPSVSSQARPWNPDFKHTERERWICIYPAYINSKKTLAEGRRVPKMKAVENPLCAEIRDVCVAAGLTLGVENKVHPREAEPRDTKYRGRVRVQLRNEDGTPVLPQFPSRQAVLLYLGQMIPKLKSRPQSSSQAPQQQAQAQQQQPAAKAQRKKGRK